MSQATIKAFGKARAGIAAGQCVCGAVRVEIGVPAFWAWHDHSRASRRAHGAAYATYVGCWRSRVRGLSPETDAAEVRELENLGSRVFNDLNLETLVRLDVRADATGKMYVLEANPKPDLKAPTAEKTSLVCASLQQFGMSYDDLVLSLLADRIDLLFACRRGTVHELIKLLQA